jgi:hypothetical protein
MGHLFLKRQIGRSQYQQTTAAALTFAITTTTLLLTYPCAAANEFAEDCVPRDPNTGQACLTKIPYYSDPKDTQSKEAQQNYNASKLPQYTNFKWKNVCKRSINIRWEAQRQTFQGKEASPTSGKVEVFSQGNGYGDQCFSFCHSVTFSYECSPPYERRERNSGSKLSKDANPSPRLTQTPSTSPAAETSFCDKIRDLDQKMTCLTDCRKDAGTCEEWKKQIPSK